MAKIKIEKDRCKSCMLCVHFCPHGLIAVSKGLNKRGVHPVEFVLQDSNKKCTGCAICALMCPDVCITVLK